MKGLEISRSYFEEYGLPMLREKFPELLPCVAAGLTGSGSECFGFDDEVSRDHDFEPGFCLFIPGEETVDRRTAFLLERAYDSLPKEYMGLKKSLVGPAGGQRRGVLRIPEYYKEKAGSEDGVLTVRQWLTTPDYVLAEAVNGEIFHDGGGTVTAIRERLSHYPRDVRLKKLAGALLMAAQAGQYNFPRCLRHGETGAAQMAAFEFVRHAVHALFLISDAYMPYYKWSFRALRELPGMQLYDILFEYILTTGNGEDTADEKIRVIEDVSSNIIDELMKRELTDAVCTDLEKHAYSVQDRIRDPEIRNLHILVTVQ